MKKTFNSDAHVPKLHGKSAQEKDIGGEEGALAVVFTRGSDVVFETASVSLAIEMAEMSELIIGTIAVPTRTIVPITVHGRDLDLVFSGVWAFDTVGVCFGFEGAVGLILVLPGAWAFDTAGTIVVLLGC